MARLTKTQKNQYRADQYDAEWPSGQGKTIEQMRDAAVAIENEIDRQRPDESVATGTMFLIGSDPNNHFDIELLAEGDVGSITLDGQNTGFKLLPIITGTGINQVNPTSGAVIESNLFDGVSEIRQGTGATENMLLVDYPGYFDVVGSCKPAPEGQQNNREVEIDLFVFDSAGNAIRSLGFIASANQSNNGRAFTQSIPNVSLDPNFLAQGEYLGLCIRKFLGEGNTIVRMSKGFLQITLKGLGD